MGVEVWLPWVRTELDQSASYSAFLSFLVACVVKYTNMPL